MNKKKLKKNHKTPYAVGLIELLVLKQCHKRNQQKLYAICSRHTNIKYLNNADLNKKKNQNQQQQCWIFHIVENEYEKNAA